MSGSANICMPTVLFTTICPPYSSLPFTTIRQPCCDRNMIDDPNTTSLCCVCTLQCVQMFTVLYEQYTVVQYCIYPFLHISLIFTLFVLPLGSIADSILSMFIWIRLFTINRIRIILFNFNFFYFC